ncbi:hypothetical protein GCM10009715_17250 [Paeniglutamicibacter psychrophenolicus]|uniref:4'-phosphopantetheinyl transferase n=1 Tax=Paeniglutamicibacter psychrophenolicus TaxID=257454 RepID=A0ABS4WCN2_9MICC|nr:hypothetical protein [Paeniglutamicibacter psychrophenolicus]MBP2373969.1 4'-phosphopantetheinyl transferase [Paeniglutamicibacter psychrophenolicus]
MVEIWWSTLAAADARLAEMLDATERSRLESLQRPADRGRSMVAAALLRVAAGARLGIDPADVVVERGCPECGAPHGPPRILRTGQAVPWVSVSHSGLLVLVALGTNGPLGVDVQRLADLPEPGHGMAWVRREAMFKAGAAGQGGGAIFRELAAPLGGYAAGLAVLAPADARGAVRWVDAAGDGVLAVSRGQTGT